MELTTVNLEEGLPTVDTALNHLKFALRRAGAGGTVALKLIHGYGSSGKGGKIRTAVRSELSKLKQAGAIRDYVTGEDFSPFSESGRTLLTLLPGCAKDHDYCRCNNGITVVIFGKRPGGK